MKRTPATMSTSTPLAVHGEAGDSTCARLDAIDGPARLRRLLRSGPGPPRRSQRRSGAVTPSASAFTPHRRSVHRCLADATVKTGLDAREIDQHDPEDGSRAAPTSMDDQLTYGRWDPRRRVLAVHDPRTCSGPTAPASACVCGEPLNGSDPGEHAHRPRHRPPLEQLEDLKVERAVNAPPAPGPRGRARVSAYCSQLPPRALRRGRQAGRGRAALRRGTSEG